MITGRTRPIWSFVLSLNCLTNCPMFTPCWPSAGPTGGAGVHCPPGTCSLIFAVSSFFAMSVTPSDRLYLPVLELHRCRPAEDRHDDLHEPLVREHLVDDAVEALEGPFLDLHGLALLELDPDLRLLLRPLHLAEELLDLVRLHRRRAPVGPHEVADARRLADQEPDVLVEVHLDEHVAGVHLALVVLLSAALDLRDGLGGNEDARELRVEAGRGDALAQILADAVLATALHAQHVPVQAHGLTPSAGISRSASSTFSS